MEKNLKAKFLKSFINIPETMREDILVVVDNKPFSWNSSVIEIKNDTAIGKKILKILEGLKIL